MVAVVAIIDLFSTSNHPYKYNKDFFLQFSIPPPPQILEEKNLEKQLLNYMLIIIRSIMLGLTEVNLTSLT